MCCYWHTNLILHLNTGTVASWHYITLLQMKFYIHDITGKKCPSNIQNLKFTIKSFQHYKLAKVVQEFKVFSSSLSLVGLSTLYMLGSFDITNRYGTQNIF